MLKHQTTTMYGAAEVKPHAFLISALNRRRCSAKCFDRANHGEKSPVSVTQGLGCVCPRAAPPARDWTLVIQPVTAGVLPLLQTELSWTPPAVKVEPKLDWALLPVVLFSSAFSHTGALKTASPRWVVVTCVTENVGMLECYCIPRLEPEAIRGVSLPVRETLSPPPSWNDHESY